MASFLAIQSATAPASAAVPAAAIQRPTTTGLPAVSPATVAESVAVTLSDAAKALAVSGDNTGGANALAAPDNGLTLQTTAGNDEQRSFNATQALQRLLDDPGLRAIRNHSDPLYSALIAASHLSDFVPAAPTGINLNAIAAEVPAPVSPVAASRAIDFYRETAAETRLQSNV